MATNEEILDSISNLTVLELWKNRTLVFAMSPGEQGFPDEFAKKGARLEMLRRREFFQRPRQSLARRRWTLCQRFRHRALKP